jgi:hypothetical protein
MDYAAYITCQTGRYYSLYARVHITNVRRFPNIPYYFLASILAYDLAVRMTISLQCSRNTTDWIDGGSQILLLIYTGVLINS